MAWRKNDPNLTNNPLYLEPRINELAEDLAENAKKIEGRISIKKFESFVLNKGQSNEDWKDAFQEAVNYIKSTGIQLVFPAGIYQYSVSPNWAFQDGQIIAEGEVRLRYTGVGYAIILDGGATGGGLYNLTFGQFIIEAPATSLDAVYARGVHHSRIDIKVLGCGTNHAGLLAEWCVCTKFDVVVSGNQEGVWYQNAKPKYGIKLTRRNTGEDTSYCLFLNPILEGIDIGAYLDYSLGNNFIGGTMEACQTFGVQLTTNAYNNKFFNVDYEVNGNADIYCDGHENYFYGCDSYGVSVLESSSKNNSIIGGSYSGLLIVAGANSNLVSSIKYNRFNNGSVITDNGTKTRFRDNYNMGANRYENAVPSRTQLSLSGSPYVYTNNSSNEENLVLLGGTISQLAYVHNGVGDVVTGLNTLRLYPGDQITITYSVAPIVIKYVG